MLTLLLTTPGLTLGPPVSPAWHVRPTSFETMKMTLINWRDTYEHGSEDFNSTLEMIAWHKTTKDKPACLALYYNHDLRALAQMRHHNEQIQLRSIITPRYEAEAGTILLLKIIRQTDVTIDWEAMKTNKRWYLAAIFATR